MVTHRSPKPKIDLGSIPLAPADTDFKCDICEKEVETQRGLNVHKNIKHGIEVNTKEFTCKHCGTVFKKYHGPNSDRKGLKYCSSKCFSESRKDSSRCSKICIECGKSYDKPNRKFCSFDCSKNYSGYTVKNSSRMGGPRPGGGRSKQIPYTNRFGESMSLNVEEISMAEYLDSTEYTWGRNTTGFSYVDLEGKSRKFYPDFYVPELDLYVEYKGWITESMTHKMCKSLENNKELKLLIVVGEDKRYADKGIKLSDLKLGEEFLREYHNL